jgi:hypothetical protein
MRLVRICGADIFNVSPVVGFVKCETTELSFHLLICGDINEFSVASVLTHKN